MRIRDRLLALATASLAPTRAPPRGTAAGHEPSQDRSHEAGVGATAPGPLLNASPPPFPATGELPRQLAELLLQSTLSSQQRLVQTGEALNVIGTALLTAELSIRQHLEAAASGAQPPPGAIAAGVMTLALHAANARAIDGSYLFGGNSAGDPPFASDGSYLGPSTSNLLIVMPTPPSPLALTAASLTSLAPLAGAVDILPRLARAQAACGSTNPRILEACRAPLAAAAAQLTQLQDRVASALAVLADATRVTEEALPARILLPESDPELNPGQLAQTFGALEAARSLAERTLAIFPAQS
jgi:hypothetical protein